MNKYTALGLAVEANDGKIVLVITGGLTHSSAARGWLAESSIKPHRVIHTNGKAAVEYASGGRIDFRSKRQDIRGMAPDIVFVDSDTELSIDEWDELRPMRKTGAHIVRA